MDSLVTLSKLLLLTGCVSQVLADPKVLPVPFSRRIGGSSGLDKRNAAAVSLANQFFFYSVNISVGTPPQSISVQIDTGSSDIWFFNAQACQEASCSGGTFNPNSSSTYELIEEGGFSIAYLDNSGASGNQISDVIDLGNGLKVSNQTMALATTAEDVEFGIFGISFESDEANNASYPTFVDSLVSADIIKSRSYSLWLDDLEANTGTLLFGGYDPDQYLGELTVLPILPDLDTGEIDSFTVDLSMVALTTEDGSTILQPNEYPIPAVLDSGTTLTLLPPDSFYQLAEFFGASYNSSSYSWVVACDIANWKGTVDYGFGGPNGTIIQVPYAELAISQLGVYEINGTCMCQFGLDVAEVVPIVGDTFLRSAYVVYDMDSLQVAIAQSAWNPTTSNPQEIDSGDDLSVLLAGSRNDTQGGELSSKDYTNVENELQATTSPVLYGVPMTASISGQSTSLSMIAAPTERAASVTASTTSSRGAATVQTAAMLLPMAIPFAAAML